MPFNAISELEKHDVKCQDSSTNEMEQSHKSSFCRLE